MSSPSPKTAPGRWGVMAWLATCGRVTGTWEPRTSHAKDTVFQVKEQSDNNDPRKTEAF